MKHSKYYEIIRQYYIEGYGTSPKKYFTNIELSNFVLKGMLSQEEMNSLIAEKAGD